MPADAESDEAQIEAVVGYFNQAAEDLDGAILCEHVLAPSLTGEKCAERVDKAMTKNPENWTPIGSVTKVEVQGSSASASGEQDGEPIELTFVRENDHWWMQVFD